MLSLESSTRPFRRARGFTFVEILAAMVFIAIVIPVTVGGALLANRAGIVAARKRVAIQLADKILTEQIVTDEWRNGDQGGDCDEDWPDYRWQMAVESWSVSAMQLVTVSVYYFVQGREFSESVSTVVDVNDTTNSSNTTSVTGSSTAGQ